MGSIGVIIRFKNAARTLPSVLGGLRRQTLQPDLTIGVNNRSTDGSADLLRQHGAKILNWNEAYNHPRVLNFALHHCPTDLILVLSSHTTLCSTNTLAEMAAAMEDPQTACVSGKWDDDPFYSDTVTWEELKANGMKFVSIYSNSFGMLRRGLWEQIQFDETLAGMEDYAWALEWVKRGYVCRRLDFPFRYERAGNGRVGFLTTVAFQLAARHHLRLVWLGPRETLTRLVLGTIHRFVTRQQIAEMRTHWERLRAWLTWKWRRYATEVEDH